MQQVEQQRRADNDRGQKDRMAVNTTANKKLSALLTVWAATRVVSASPARGSSRMAPSAKHRIAPRPSANISPLKNFAECLYCA
jgi:hypothetical protein